MALPASTHLPTLMDRLCGAPAQVTPRLSIEQMRDSVARDLEALLNTRCASDPAPLEAYPECAASILGYGLIDFAGFCLSSSEDRAAICASLTGAIRRHEPRLRQVSASLATDEGSVNGLNFVINAALVVGESSEAVNFNAVLQPSSLHDAISAAAGPLRPARP